MSRYIDRVGIQIDSEKVDAKYEILEKQRQEFVSNFDEYEAQIEKLKQCWTGIGGDDAYTCLKKHKQTFEDILYDLERFNLFLDTAKEAYVNADNSLNRFIDESAEEQ